MRIFIVPSWYPNELNNIRGVFFKEQAQALLKSGIEIVVLYPELRSLKEIGKYTSKGIVKSLEDGVLTYRYNSYNYFPKISFYPYIINKIILKKLYSKAVKENGEPDLIHAHSTLWGGVAASNIVKKINVPLIITEHSSAFGRYKLSKFKKKIVKNAILNSSELLAVSDMLKNEMHKYSSNKEIKVVPNMIDTEMFTLKGPNSFNDKFRFFSAGFLNYNKGMDLLIKAFNVFKDLEVELIIAGDGVELNKLMDLTNLLGLEKQVIFLGRISRDDMKIQMQKCNSFVLASRYETFGVVYAEALACGKPVIATKCGGPEMIVNDENGILVSKENIDELSRAMLRMFNNIQNFDSTKIRKKCLEKYSEKTIVNELNSIYYEVVSKYNLENKKKVSK